MSLFHWKKKQANFTSLDSLDEETREEVLEFVGRKKDFYEKKWSKLSNRGSPFSWNWSAFLLGLFWFAFRKMNVYAYSILGLIVVVDVLLITFFKKSSSSTTFSAVFFIIAVTANISYFDFVLKKVKRLKTLYPAREERLEVIRKHGGVSWLHAIIFIVVMVIYLFSISFLGEKVYYAYAEPKFSKAVKLQESGKFDEAIEIYDDIENRNVPIPGIYFNKALIYESKKEYDQALKQINIYLNLVPGDKSALDLKEKFLEAKK